MGTKWSGQNIKKQSQLNASVYQEITKNQKVLKLCALSVTIKFGVS